MRVGRKRTETKVRSTVAAPVELPHPGDALPPGARVRLGTNRLNHVVQRGNTGVCHLSFSPDGRYLFAVGYEDGEASLWELPGGREVWRREVDCRSEPFAASAFSPDGRLLAVGGCRGARVIDVVTGRTAQILQTDGRYDLALAFSPCGRYLVAPPSVWAVDRWEVTSGLDARGAALAFSPGGRFLAGSAGDTVCVWEWPGLRLVNRLEGPPSAVNVLHFLPDGRLAASAWDETVRAWDIATGRELWSRRWGERGNNPFAVAFQPGGRGLALPSEVGPTRVIDLETGAELRRFDRFVGSICLAWSPDGRTLATAEDGRCHLWDMETGTDSAPPGRHLGRPDAITFSGDGRRVLTASGLNPCEALVWDAGTGALVATVPPAFTDDPYSLALAPDGACVAASHVPVKRGRGRIKRRVRVWDIASGSVREVPTPTEPGALTWELAPTVPVPPFDIPEGFGQASYNGFGVSAESLADGRMLVAACRGSPEAGGPFVAKVWEAETGVEVWESPEFPCGISEVVLAPGGRSLAVGLDDATTVLFDIPVRPLALDPSWLTGTVVALARGIVADRAFDRLPILADALQDAGCDSTDVLTLCRDPNVTPARRGWVVDLVLGKE